MHEFSIYYYATNNRNGNLFRQWNLVFHNIAFSSDPVKLASNWFLAVLPLLQMNGLLANTIALHITDRSDDCELLRNISLRTGRVHVYSFSLMISNIRFRICLWMWLWQGSHRSPTRSEWTWVVSAAPTHCSTYAPHIRCNPDIRSRHKWVQANLHNIYNYAMITVFQMHTLWQLDPSPPHMRCSWSVACSRRHHRQRLAVP